MFRFLESDPGKNTHHGFHPRGINSQWGTTKRLRGFCTEDQRPRTGHVAPTQNDPAATIELRREQEKWKENESAVILRLAATAVRGREREYCGGQ
ncbi:hypothetical protein NL676_022585 [Syzygium grande]|nr:hypothetical protein NL676_022585 [Syzygium grande]